MHLVPEDRAHRRAIDEHSVCEAISGIGDPESVRAWASRFSMLADPNRLSVLLAIHRAGPIAVTDLALATGVNESAVSQILRLLRVSGTVAAAKDGRIVRYRLVDQDTAVLLDAVPPLNQAV
jgi:DNA-binding transcriptional ArsR family regulator